MMCNSRPKCYEGYQEGLKEEYQAAQARRRVGWFLSSWNWKLFTVRNLNCFVETSVLSAYFPVHLWRQFVFSCFIMVSPFKDLSRFSRTRSKYARCTMFSHHWTIYDSHLSMLCWRLTRIWRTTRITVTPEEQEFFQRWAKDGNGVYWKNPTQLRTAGGWQRHALASCCKEKSFEALGLLGCSVSKQIDHDV